MVSMEGFEPSRLEARSLRPLRLPFRHMDMLSCRAWESNPPETACRTVALPENEPCVAQLPAARWGSRESNAEQAPYQRAQVTVPSYPDILREVPAEGVEPTLNRF